MNTFDVIAAVLVLAGASLALTAAIGVVRFPDTLSRMHAASKPQVLGLLLVLAGAALVAAVALAASGTSMAVCLLVVTAAPVVVVVGFEAVGHRHAAAIVDRRLDIHRPG